MRQYIAIKFKPDGRPYTYHWDGPDPIKVGDRVEVVSFVSKTAVAVEVVGVSEEAPKFQTKPVVRRVPVEPSDDRKAELTGGATPATSEEAAWLEKERAEKPNDSLEGL